MPTQSKLSTLVFLLVFMGSALTYMPVRALVGLRTCWPELIVIHHTALPDALGDERVTARVLGRLHARRGFGIICSGKLYRIGYHYFVLEDGTIETGRPESCYGAHAGDGHINSRSLGVALAGNFDSRSEFSGMRSEPTAAQITALTRLLRILLTKHHLAASAIVGHREVRPGTVCPGDTLQLGPIRAAMTKAVTETRSTEVR